MVAQPKLKVLLSLITPDADYQLEEGVVAERVALQQGLALNVDYADSDGVYQTLQILKVIQSEPELRPDGVIVEPVGTGMVQVAQAAAKAGIAWVILNHDAEYLGKLRAKFQVPIFAVSTDNDQVGRIQGRQINALVRSGGCVLYLEGPSNSDAARHRTQGMLAVKRADIALTGLRGGWTTTGSYRAVQSWLQLCMGKDVKLDAVVCQNDTMAMGARKAFEEIAQVTLRERFLALPFLGCDGVAGTGQAWVRRGLLKATIINPPLTGIAVEMLANALRLRAQPPERTLITPVPFPSVESLQIPAPASAIVGLTT